MPMRNYLLVVLVVLVLVVVSAAFLLLPKPAEVTKTTPPQTTPATKPPQTTPPQTTPPQTTPATKPPQTTPATKVSLLGSGATFPYPQIAAWISEFTKRYPNVTINYNPIGSGAGQEQFFTGVVDFAASDPPVSKEKWESLRGKFVQVPFIIGAAVIIYNVPELGGAKLKLDAETIALIYKGEIQQWNDERIRRINPGLDLPAKRITAVHRSDSSGTTEMFTRFLHKAAPQAWPKELVGKSIEWPVDKKGNGVGGKGNQGVAELVRTTPGSIGYVELAHALETGMPTALLKNRDGVFVEANETTIMNAAKGAAASLPSSPDGDFSGDVDVMLYAPGRLSYPITSFSHLLFYTSYSDPAKAWAVRKFIEYVNTEGQGKLLKGYVPVPPEVRRLNLKAVELIKGG